MENLSEQQLEAISNAVLHYYEERREIEEKRERDRRLRNTKLILKNYHTFKVYADKQKKKLDVPEEPKVIELVLNSEDIVDSIRQTTERTLAMIQYLDKALSTLEHICAKENSKHYEVLHLRYLERRAIHEIADWYNVNERTVYKQLDAAIEPLSVLLFGVYGLKISS